MMLATEEKNRCEGNIMTKIIYFNVTNIVVRCNRHSYQSSTYKYFSLSLFYLSVHSSKTNSFFKRKSSYTLQQNL